MPIALGLVSMAALAGAFLLIDNRAHDGPIFAALAAAVVASGLLVWWTAFRAPRPLMSRVALRRMLYEGNGWADTAVVLLATVGLMIVPYHVGGTHVLEPARELPMIAFTWLVVAGVALAFR